MKRILLPLFTFFATAAFAQADCDPMAQDFGDVLYGVYPDTAVGIADGVLNQPYNQVIYILVPEDASVIDPTIGAFATLNEVSLAGVSYVDANGDTLDISNLGLTLECNPASCVFLPGQQYCGIISGTPNQVGEFPVIIEADVNVTFLAFEQNVPYDFGGYTYTVTATAAVDAKAGNTFSMGQCMPNPANNRALLEFTLLNQEEVEFSVVNMVGERVLSKTIFGKRGENNFSFDVSDLPSGIYLYTVQAGNQKATRKLVIQH